MSRYLGGDIFPVPIVPHGDRLADHTGFKSDMGRNFKATLKLSKVPGSVWLLLNFALKSVVTQFLP